MQHTTVKVTEKDIKQYDPCSQGLKLVSRFLPLKLSTDPDENCELASRMLDVEHGRLAYHVQWYLTNLNTSPHYHGALYDGALYDEADYYNRVPAEWCTSMCAQLVDEWVTGTFYNAPDGSLKPVHAHPDGHGYRRGSGVFAHFSEDPGIVAQWLANIADVLDKRRRRARSRKARK